PRLIRQTDDHSILTGRDYPRHNKVYLEQETETIPLRTDTMATEKVYIYKAYERFWHWTQAFLVLFLALTGFEIHGSLNLFGFETAVTLHNNAAWAFIILTIF